MRNRMLTAAALSALLAGSAVAQTAAPAPSNNNTATPPAASSPSNAPSGAMKMPSDTRANAATGTTTTGAFIDAQDREQWLATTLIGTDVRGAADENLGEVSDVLMDRNGNVVGAVIGVGGFLGIGQKDVAVPFNALELVRNGDDEKLVLRKSKDELTAAPEFKEYTPNRTAPAAGGSTGSSAPVTTPPASAR
ncbi:MAG: PRC-barrel domain-containing protein [Pseudomonadota bacterium]